MKEKMLEGKIALITGAARGIGAEIARTLSDELGVAVQTVYRWERGKRIPDVVTFMHIAKALGVSIEKLLGEES